MVVNFYSTSSDEKKVDKSLNSLGSCDCQLQEPCEVLRPVFIVDRSEISNFAICNYMFIPNLGRYYYAKLRMLPGGMLEITGNVDVLMSWRSGIRGVTCDIVRQEHNYNEFYVDTLLPKRSSKNIQYLKIGEIPANNGIYLTVTGGV